MTIDEAIKHAEEVAEKNEKIVIENYFKSECNINTTIHDAYVKGFERGLSKAPQPERKTGHWILFDSVSERYEDIECSECGKLFTVDAKRYCDIGFIVGDLNYCPNCGCKMEVEHE